MPGFKVKRHKANNEIEIEAANSLEAIDVVARQTNSSYEVDFSKKPLTWECDTGKEFYTLPLSDIDKLGDEEYRRLLSKEIASNK